MSRLPIEDVLEELIAVISAGVAVLQAPPGAGKTTRVPQALLEAGAFEGKLVMLEPRRLATRAAAERMAEMLGEPVGQTVGFRMRGETVVSDATRIEVVTEGILTRMIQSDPELAGVGCVVFDEFHERSLNGDLGLALVQEIRGALRPDLKLLVMSATLDAAPVANLLKAPVVTSQGRAFPVETRWLDRPLGKVRFETAVADLVDRALDEEEGSALVFLPGEGEIRRVARLLDVPGVEIRPLYGALPFKDQRTAIRPSEARKVVLATSIAETSLTIEGIRIVVDAGRSRRARFDAAAGMTRLVTEAVSRAEADQRRGRAGRTAPGVCYRMWAKAQEGALPAFPPTEIETADLTALALELANWGAAANALDFLTQPPETALREAEALLEMLGAIKGGRITEHGKRLAAMPVHPRIAHMLANCGNGAELAALLSERDPLGPAAGSDIAARLKALREPPEAANRQALTRIRQEAKRLKRFARGSDRSFGELAALAYPDRVGLRRAGISPRYVLSGGKGAALSDEDALSTQRMIVALDLGGDDRDARCRLAAAITESELRGLFSDQIGWHEFCCWSKRERRVLARRQERFGALVLKDEIWRSAPPEEIARAVLDGVRHLGLSLLGWSKSARLLRARVETLRAHGTEMMPDWSDDGLLACLDTWLLPFLAGVRDASGLKALDPFDALKADLGWDRMAELDRLAPPHFTTPLGRKLALDYSGDVPALEVRLQEMFGVTTHPVVGPLRVPVQITLLSPAHRPVQVTTDLPGFWDGSYADVCKDMKARYPKHPWPENPRDADPTLRAKRRKS